MRNRSLARGREQGGDVLPSLIFQVRSTCEVYQIVSSFYCRTLVLMDRHIQNFLRCQQGNLARMCFITVASSLLSQPVMTGEQSLLQNMETHLLLLKEHQGLKGLLSSRLYSCALRAITGDIK